MTSTSVRDNLSVTAAAPGLDTAAPAATPVSTSSATPVRNPSSAPVVPSSGSQRGEPTGSGRASSSQARLTARSAGLILAGLAAVATVSVVAGIAYRAASSGPTAAASTTHDEPWAVVHGAAGTFVTADGRQVVTSAPADDATLLPATASMVQSRSARSLPLEASPVTPVAAVTDDTALKPATAAMLRTPAIAAIAAIAAGRAPVASAARSTSPRTDRAATRAALVEVNGQLVGH